MSSLLMWPKAALRIADAEIERLEAAISRFLSSTPVSIKKEVDLDLEEEIWWFEINTCISDEIIITIKNILSNIRDPLDQSICAIAEKEGLNQSGFAYQFGNSREKFLHNLRKLRKLPFELIEIVERSRPYPGGNETLWALNRANNRLKHRALVVPAGSVGSLRNSYLSVWNGQALVIGNLLGQHFVVERTICDRDYLNGWSGHPWSSYGLNHMNPITGLPYAPTTVEIEYKNKTLSANRLSFLTTTPGARVAHDFSVEFEIAFSEEVGIGVRPVLPFLKEALAQVSEIVAAIDRDF